MAKKQKKKTETKGTTVEMGEVIEMKVLDTLAVPRAEIARRLRRNRKTVDRSLEAIEQILPQDAGIMEDVISGIEQMKQDMLANARDMVFMADQVVSERIGSEETTAIEAAKVSDIYFRRTAMLTGLVKSPMAEDAEIAPKVINIINNVFNITPRHDHIPADKRDRAADEGAHARGEAAAAA